MAKIFAQIVIDLELDELSVNGTLLDLRGLSIVVKDHLESLPMNGPELRVLGAQSPTKDWEIASQLTLQRKFGDEH